MATEVIMPKVDMVMDDGTFVEWLKQEGDTVEKGEPLFVILTDKANIEIEAPGSGILAGISAQPDDVIPVSATIAYLLEDGEALPSEAGSAPADADSAELPVASKASLAQTAPSTVPQTTVTGRVRATPVARRLASELGIDLTQLSGRGPQGRIHKTDVLEFQQQKLLKPKATPVAAAASILTGAGMQIPLPDARRRKTVPLAGPRRIIAERMAYSAATAPHITLSLRVDMREATRLRQQLLEPVQQETGYRLSFTAIIAKAVAMTLPNHAYLNASLNGGEIILWEDVHLGIATSVDDNLIVPVIRGAEAKDLYQMVTALGDLTERARARRLTPIEMSGSTFTITNLGMFGIESFTAIVNPPEAGILAVGRIMETAVRSKGKPRLRPLMSLTLSADHRVVDGAGGARFLADLKEALENPYRLL